MLQSTLASRLSRAFASLVVLALSACASGGGSSDSKTVKGIQFKTLQIGQGIVFETGEIVDDDKFNEVDLLTYAGGSAPKLVTGGATSAENAPVNWFKGAGGIAQTFVMLADVPLEKPAAADTVALNNPKVGNGFVVEGFISNGWARGIITRVQADEVEFEYEFVPATKAE